jgi:hypothetical protein
MIQPGEKITFVTITKRGRCYHCSAKDGTMVEFRKNTSKVKTKNGRIVYVDTADIRLAAQKNALTEALQKQCPEAFTEKEKA